MSDHAIECSIDKNGVDRAGQTTADQQRGLAVQTSADRLVSLSQRDKINVESTDCNTVLNPKN